MSAPSAAPATHTCRYADKCMYIDGPHKPEGDHAWTDSTAGVVVNGRSGSVYVYSLYDGEYPIEVLIGVQLDDDPDHPMEARLSVEQAAHLLTLLAQAVHYGQRTADIQQGLVL